MSMEVRLNTHGPGKLQTLAMISDEAGFNVVSTLIFGEKDAVLIDCQWTRSNAYRVIAEICERNLNLKAVFATHAHPDHYWGIGHVKEAFPDCICYAMEEDIETIDAQFGDKVEHWESIIGKVNLCRADRYPKLTPLPKDNKIMLEGEEIVVFPQVWGDLQYNTVVWVPSISTVIGSDVLFSNAHPFTCEVSANGRKKWIDALDKMEALGAEVVIPGHMKHGEPFDERSYKFTRDYLIETDKELDKLRKKYNITKDGEVNEMAMKEFFYDLCMKFPDAILIFLSNDMNSSVFLGGREWNWNNLNDGPDMTGINTSIHK